MPDRTFFSAHTRTAPVDPVPEMPESPRDGAPRDEAPRDQAPRDKAPLDELPLDELLPSKGADTVGAAHRALWARFRKAGIESAELDARLLVAALTGLSAAQVIASPERKLMPAERRALLAAARRRLAREPVSRILGRRQFWKGEFLIGPATLDPRPESETLVAAALALLEAQGRREAPLKIADPGTGSGALLISLLGELANARGLGTDLSPPALALARQNAERAGVAARAAFVATSWLEGVETKFDLIVCNPPYVARSEISRLPPEVRDHDPTLALDGGADGLDAYRQIAPQLRARLADRGLVLLEVGVGQAPAVAALLAEHGLESLAAEAAILRDLSARQRCLAATIRGQLQKGVGNHHRSR